MVKIYARWVRDGKIRLEDVPPRWRAAVQTMLAETTQTPKEEGENG